MGLIILGIPLLGIIAGLCAGVVSYLIGFSFWIPALTCAVLGFGFGTIAVRGYGGSDGGFAAFAGIPLIAGISAGVALYLLGCGPWVSALAGALLAMVYSYCAGFKDFGRNMRY